MADLVDLKLTSADRKAEYGESVGGDMPDYSYGMRLYLDGPAMDKLGLTANSFNPGDKVTFVVEASVASISMDKSASGDRQSMSVVVEKMSRPSTGAPAVSLASSLYSSGGS